MRRLAFGRSPGSQRAWQGHPHDTTLRGGKSFPFPPVRARPVPDPNSPWLVTRSSFLHHHGWGARRVSTGLLDRTLVHGSAKEPAGPTAPRADSSKKPKPRDSKRSSRVGRARRSTVNGNQIEK